MPGSSPAASRAARLPTAPAFRCTLPFRTRGETWFHELSDPGPDNSGVASLEHDHNVPREHTKLVADVRCRRAEAERLEDKNRRRRRERDNRHAPPPTHPGGNQPPPTPGDTPPAPMPRGSAVVGKFTRCEKKPQPHLANQPCNNWAEGRPCARVIVSTGDCPFRHDSACGSPPAAPAAGPNGPGPTAPAGGAPIALNPI